MKTLLAALVLPLVLVASASADWVIESKIESSMMNANTTMKIKGDKMRNDIKGGPAGDMTTIMDATSGDTITLMHAQKMAMKSSGAQLKQAMDAARKMLGSAPAAGAPAITPTGKSEKVGQYDCDIYTWTDGNTSTTYWVAKKYPGADSLKAFQKQMAKGALGGAQVGPDPNSLPGVAIKTLVETKGGGSVPAMKMTTTITSAKEQNVDASEFEVPARYQTMAMPSLPGAAK